MGGALLRGAIQAGVVNAAEVRLFDVFPGASAALAEDTGATAVESLRALVEASDTLLLCTKPGDIPGVLRELADNTTGGRLLVSIAAGVTLATLEGGSPERIRVIRVMPNTPALVHEGAAAWAGGSRSTAEDGELAGRLLGAVGHVVQVPEKLMDAVTALSGSGPAYGYLMIEALADGGVRQGLPRDTALRLAAQTLLGAAKMVMETGEHPGALKDMVTSPGGTTIAGLAVLEREGVRSALIEAVAAAAARAKELGAS